MRLYSEDDFEAMKGNHDMRRQYVWNVAMNAKRLANEARKQAKKASFGEGADLLRQAKVLDRFHEFGLRFIDKLAE